LCQFRHPLGEARFFSKGMGVVDRDEKYGKIFRTKIIYGARLSGKSPPMTGGVGDE